MNSIRIKFIRGEEVKFISHLDLMKVYERALRREFLPIAYSQGFNPHAHMIFGLPLSVGVTSQAEYADFELTEEVIEEDFKVKLNKALPLGLKVLDAKIKHSKENIMASIGAAAYQILVSVDTEIDENEIKGILKKFLMEPVIIVKKESKKGLRDVDIKAMILKIDITHLNGEAERPQDFRLLKEYIQLQSVSSVLPPSYSLKNLFCISSLLSAGSVANLKPELLFAAFSHYFGNGMKLVKIHRTGLFLGIDGDLKEPLDASAL